MYWTNAEHCGQVGASLNITDMSCCSFMFFNWPIITETTMDAVAHFIHKQLFYMGTDLVQFNISLCTLL